ncbi:MAG TPA: hypothetical protein VH210_13720 [Gaiellaceae bacterium]|nr:hypothetical protein [Gaiellaceae bacterium]
MAGVLGAFAIGAPIAGAAPLPTLAGLPAFTPPAVAPLPAIAPLPAAGTLPAFTGLPAFAGLPGDFVAPAVGFVGVAIGPTVIGSVFNGATVVQVDNGPAGSSVIASP